MDLIFFLNLTNSIVGEKNNPLFINLIDLLKSLNYI